MGNYKININIKFDGNLAIKSDFLLIYLDHRWSVLYRNGLWLDKSIHNLFCPSATNPDKFFQQSVRQVAATPSEYSFSMRELCNCDYSA